MVVLRNDHVAEHSAGTQDFTDNADAGKGDGKTKAHADTVKCGYHRSVLGRIGLCAAKDDTVNHNQRDIDTKRSVKAWHIGLKQQLYDGNQGSHDNDIGRDTHTVRYDLAKG